MNRLTWATASEHMSERFELLRSSDALNYAPIASIPAAGESQSTLNYMFTDTDPLEGVSYYRLRQVDNDGVDSRSNTVSVVFKRADNDLLIFPNPGNDRMELVVGPDLEGTSICLLDATGREVMRNLITGERLSLSTGALPLGIYSVWVVRSNGSHLARGTWVKR